MKSPALHPEKCRPTVYETVNKSEPLTKVIGHLLNYILSGRALKKCRRPGKKKLAVNRFVSYLKFIKRHEVSGCVSFSSFSY